MDVNIIPTYHCQLHCDYCFLGNQFDNKQCIDLNVLEDQLKEVSEVYGIDRIDLFGGELSTYNEIGRLVTIVEQFSSNISLATNCQNPDILNYIDRVDLSISLNPSRNDFKRNVKLIKSLPKDVRSKLYISTVVLPDLIARNPKLYLDFIDELQIKSLYFLQYYRPMYGRKKYAISNNEFVQYMCNVLEVYRNNHYTFCLENINAYKNRSDPHISNYIFINPYNQYGCTSYSNGDEQFVWVDNLSQYNQLIALERLKYFSQCGMCQYYKNCLAEHLHSHDQNDQCCGLPKLIKFIDKYIYVRLIKRN